MAGLEVVAVGPGVLAAWVRVAEAEVVAGAEVCVVGVVPFVAGWLLLGAVAGLEVPVPEGVPVPDGEKIAGTLDDGAVVHAERATETRIIKVAQLRAVRRAFIEASLNAQRAASFPDPGGTDRDRHPKIINAASRVTAHTNGS